MSLIQIALAHLKVRKGKTGFLLLGILLCIGTLVAFYTVNQSLQAQLQQQLHKAGFRFLVTPRNQQMSMSYYGVVVRENSDIQPLVLPQEYFEDIKQLALPGIDVVSPKLVVATELMGKQVLLCGLDFLQERELQDWWELQQGHFPERAGEILLGADSGISTGFPVGEQVEFWGRSFQVVGILAAAGHPEDRLILMDLAELQSLTAIDGFSFLELRAQPIGKEGSISNQAEQWYQRLGEKMPEAKVVRVKDENLLRQGLLQQFVRFAAGTTAVVFTIGWLMIAITIAASVKERVGEIGTLRAMGYRKQHIMQVIFWEAGLVSSLGGFLGYLVGRGLGAGLLPLLGGGTSTNEAWQPYLFMMVLGISLLVGLSAAFYPAYRAAELDPVQALRQL